ncbi:MAG: MoxR family ATPase [Planctomycetes bacterium]|nr:MoxR family ATPase [Planctomycetota bacterium]
MDIADVRSLAEQMESRIGELVVGQERAVRLLLVALLAEGHVLLEGMPGTAKTLLARTFASGLALDFERIQFTPDLMPGDVLGTNIFDFRTNAFVLTRGPIFTQVLLADEINRTPPKTQAALLQAMQERCVTLDGETHDLGPGFMVVATQNPIEHEGTYPLPEAQLDRFLLKVHVGYPEREAERRMVRLHGHRAGTPDPAALGMRTFASLDTLLAVRAHVASLRLSDDLLDYVVDVCRATREHPALTAGASPRAVVMLCLAARAAAALDGREYAVPDDVQALVQPVLEHRIVLAPGAELEGQSARDVLEQIVAQVPVPR